MNANQAQGTSEAFPKASCLDASSPTEIPDVSMMQGPAVPVSEDLCIHHLFEAQAALTPDAVAVEENGSTLSYRALNERANQLAHHLIKLGVRPNTLVGILLERSIDAVVSIYATLKAGGAYVPLDPAYPAERLEYMMEASKAAVLITRDRPDTAPNPDAAVRVVRLDRDAPLLRGESSANPAVPVSPDDLIYVIFTSGSTGRPKGAAVYHKGFTNLLHWFTTEFALSAADHILLVSSLSFDLTQKNLYAALIRGGSLHLYPHGPYDVPLLSQLIRSRGITLLNCTPSAFYPLVEQPSAESWPCLSTLRVVCLGGESISIPRLRPWLTHPDCHAEIANTYGPTECTDICGAYRMDRDNLDAYGFVPLGRPVYNVQLAIVDADLQPCPVGVPGELCVAGAGVGAGYLGDPELTSAKFVPNRIAGMLGEKIYRTGDQARWLRDGVIEFLGRLDHQVKIRGFRIELHEVEAALSAHPKVREAIVIVHESTAGAEPRLVGFYTSKSGADIAADDLKTFLTARLPAHMVPASLHQLQTFPLSPNGKVDRRALRELPSLAPKPNPPGTASAFEDKIRTVWLSVLGGTEVDPDANFFDLGGDSIQLARVHVGLQQVLGQEFPITTLFACTTIRTLARHFNPTLATAAPGHAVQDRARLQREAAAHRRIARR